METPGATIVSKCSCPNLSLKVFKASNYSNLPNQAASNGSPKAQCSQTNNGVLGTEVICYIWKMCILIPSSTTLCLFNPCFPSQDDYKLIQSKWYIKIIPIVLNLPIMQEMPKEGKEIWRTARVAPIKPLLSSGFWPYQINQHPSEAHLSLPPSFIP